LTEGVKKKVTEKSNARKKIKPLLTVRR